MALDQAGNIAFWVAADGGAGGDGTQQNPFNTIEAAQAAVRTVLQSPGPLDRDIVVYIGDGTYQLQATLTFDAADSGRDGHVVHYQAVSGEHPVISGGQAVTNWSAVTNPHLSLAPGVQIWQASVDPALDTRQLYIDGERGVRAETNTEDVYPLGFRPTYHDVPGVSGIQYVVNGDNSANWQDPTTWGNVTDVEAVVYSQWKMASVPLKQVFAPSSSIPSVDPINAPTVGLIDLVDPAWTNANLIRNLPTGSATNGSTTIDLDGQLAVDNIHVGMTIAGTSANGTQIDLGIVVQVDPVTNQIQTSNQATIDGTLTLSIIDTATQEQVLGQPNEWSFWRVTKFVNAYEFMDKPGEWYLDRSTGTLYLVADAGVDPNSLDIQMPVLEKLIEGNGVSNISFEGLTFKYATWLDPNRVVIDPVNGPTGDGYVSDQAGFHLVGDGHEANQIGHFIDVTRTPGNLSFYNGTGITFSDNIFSHLGAVGLDFAGGAQGNRISHNIFQDISGAAIQIGGVSDADARPSSDAGITRNNRVDGNYIQGVGAEFIDVPGIFIGYAQNTRIEDNFISDVPWAGISIGWGWGLRDRWLAYDSNTGQYVDQGSFPGLDGANPGMWGFNTTPTIMGGNEITGNYITRFLQKAWDGGAIYTTGFQDGDPADLGLDGTLIAENYAYNKTPGAGGNVFYTDGGSRFLELLKNISFGNAIGNFNFGPAFDPDDPLNLANPFKIFPEVNVLKYGSDIGGCVTYGDILYAENRWENWWLANVFSENPSDFPLNPLYYDPGRHGTANDPVGLSQLPGAPFPTNLQFLSNIQISGWWGATLPEVSVDDVLAFVRPTAISVARVDKHGGQVTFGFQSLDDGHTMSLLDDTQGGSAGALSYNSAWDGSWLASEGRAFGSVGAVPGQVAAGVWLPTAMLDGQALELISLETDGNSGLATFDGGYQASFTLGGSRSIPTVDISDDVVVTVKRLSAYADGLAFYEADQRTGAIEVNGQFLMPGDAGYLQGALANARANNLLIDPGQLPGFGQEVVLEHVPLNDTRSYGLLLLINGDDDHLFSSFAAANPNGAVQMISLGSPDGGVTFGFEDLLVNGGYSDRDYNDLIVSFARTNPDLLF